MLMTDQLVILSLTSYVLSPLSWPIFACLSRRDSHASSCWGFVYLLSAWLTPFRYSGPLIHLGLLDFFLSPCNSSLLIYTQSSYLCRADASVFWFSSGKRITSAVTLTANLVDYYCAFPIDKILFISGCRPAFAVVFRCLLGFEYCPVLSHWRCPKTCCVWPPMSPQHCPSVMGTSSVHWRSVSSCIGCRESDWGPISSSMAWMHLRMPPRCLPFRILFAHAGQVWEKRCSPSQRDYTLTWWDGLHASMIPGAIQNGLSKAEDSIIPGRPTEKGLTK